MLLGGWLDILCWLCSQMGSFMEHPVSSAVINIYDISRWSWFYILLYCTFAHHITPLALAGSLVALSTLSGWKPETAAGFWGQVRGPRCVWCIMSSSSMGHLSASEHYTGASPLSVIFTWPHCLESAAWLFPGAKSSMHGQDQVPTSKILSDWISKNRSLNCLGISFLGLCELWTELLKTAFPVVLQHQNCADRTTPLLLE